MEKILQPFKTVVFLLVQIFISFSAQAAPPTILLSTATDYKLSPSYVSGVIADPTDPAAKLGINFIIGDPVVAVGSLTLTATSSKTSVVPNSAANLIISGTGALRNLKIIPVGVGYANITVKVSNGSSTASYVINYAASVSALTPAKTFFNTGACDASTAIPVDANYMLVGDDEDQKIRLFRRDSSGLAVKYFDFSPTNGSGDPPLHLTDISSGIPREIDLEASTLSPTNSKRIYWMGSLSNAESGNSRPNRDRFFATDMSGAGTSLNLTFVGYYSNLKPTLVSWGDANGYNFTAAAATGKDPKTIDGFNIEGLTVSPDGKDAYIGFRAPLVPVTSRTNAVIAPIKNFETWFNNGSPAGAPTIGTPIVLNLGGRGIRSIERNAAGDYLIVAGSVDGTPNSATYSWTGNASDSPILLCVDYIGENPEGIVDFPSGLSNGAVFDLLSDMGSNDWYNDGTDSKDLTQANWQKSTYNVVTSCTSLPVQLVYFNAEKLSQSILLKWQMVEGNERNILQRSSDAINFSDVFYIETDKNFEDTEVLEGHTYYYRIMNEDASGEKSFSETISVSSNNILATHSLYVYPNPNEGRFIIQSINHLGGKVDISILDALGKTVFLDHSDVNDELVINLAVPPGIYWLNVADDKEVIYKNKLIVY